MAIPLAVLVVAIVLFLVRWAWDVMKRSDDPAVQEAVETFNQQVDKLHQALGRLWDAIIHPK